MVLSPVSVEATSPEDQLRALRALYEASARAQLEAADRLSPGSDAVESRGALVAGVALVKGLPGPAEAGGAALSGEDGDAAFAAMEALGWSPDEIFCVLSRPEPGADAASCAKRMRAVIEAVDPRLVVALDGVAAHDIARGFGFELPASGVAIDVCGRRFVAVDGFEAALADEGRKRAVWVQMQSARPVGTVY